jgi:hypothetical protein
LTGDGSATTLGAGEIALRGSTGTQISSISGAAPIAAVTPEVDGTYYVDIQSRFNNATDDYVT